MPRGHLVEQRIGELTPGCSILDTKQVNTPPASPPLAPTVPTEPTLSLPLTLPYSAVQSPRRCNCTYISQHPTYILNYYYRADWTGTTTQLLFQSILMNDPVGQIAWYVTPACFYSASRMSYPFVLYPSHSTPSLRSYLIRICSALHKKINICGG